MPRSSLRAVLFVAGMLVLSACGDAAPVDPPTPAMSPTQILLPAPLPTATMEAAAAPPTSEPPTEILEPAATVTPPGGGWREFRSTAGNFRVVLPDTPAEQVTTADSAAGKIAVHTFLVAEETVAFVVSYADYPPAVIVKGGPAALLQTVRQAALSSQDSQIVGEDTLNWHGYPGIALRTKTGNAVMRSRGYVVESRLYTLSGATADNTTRMDDVTRFLDSFELLTPPGRATPTPDRPAAQRVGSATPTAVPRANGGTARPSPTPVRRANDGARVLGKAAGGATPYSLQPRR